MTPEKLDGRAPQSWNDTLAAAPLEQPQEHLAALLRFGVAMLPQLQRVRKHIILARHA